MTGSAHRLSSRRFPRSAVAGAAGLAAALLLSACSSDGPGGAGSSSTTSSSSSSSVSSSDTSTAAAATSSASTGSSDTATSSADSSTASATESSSAATASGGTAGSATGSGAAGGGAGTVDALTLSADQITAVKAKSSGQTIGILAPLSSEYLSNVVAGAKAEAQTLGYQTSVVDYQFDDAKAVAGIESLTSQGVKYIVGVLTDPPAMIGAVKAAEAKGVTFIQFAGDQVAEQTGGYSIAIDDAQLGTAAGQAAAAIAKTRGAIQIAILDYPSQPNVVIRADAMAAAIKAGAPQATVVARATGGTEDVGLTASESLLQKYPNLGGIVSVNDAGGYGAVQAFQSAKKNGDTAFVVGCDAESKARSLISQGGIFKATVDTQPTLTGTAAVEAIGVLVTGGKVAKETTVPVKTVTQ